MRTCNLTEGSLSGEMTFNLKLKWQVYLSLENCGDGGSGE